MHNNYILRTGHDLYSFYHTYDKGIVYRSYNNGRWSGEKIIVGDGRSGYTVTKNENGDIYIFCQDVQGDVVMSVCRDEEWSSRVVLKNPSSNRQNVILYPMITENGLCIIYNVTAGDDRGGYIVMQRLDRNGQWQPASRIDKLYEMNNALYYVQQLTSEHILLFYQTKTPENNLVYREITPDLHSGVKVIHNTGYNIIDSAFLTTKKGVHALYIVRNMFSSQLIYRQKMSEQFSAPIVLCEGQSIQNCMLYFMRDNLYATFMNNSQLFYCVSDDKGATFSRPVKYMSKICLDPVKAEYIDDNQAENGLCCRQVYVDRNNPWHIQILPEMYEDFYPHIVQAQAAPPKINPANMEEDGRYEELIERLKNRITLLERQNAEKDKQLMNLTVALKNKNDDIINIELEKKTMYRMYMEDVERLRRELESWNVPVDLKEMSDAVGVTGALPEETGEALETAEIEEDVVGVKDTE